MNLSLGYFLVALLFVGTASYVFSQMILPWVISKATRWGILDLPDPRKPHRMPIPRFGGLGILPGLWLGCSIALFLHRLLPSDFLSRNSSLFFELIIGLFIGATGMFALGTIDDFKGLRVRHKLPVQMVLAALSLSFFPNTSVLFGIQMDPWILKSLFWVWLVIVPNSVNLMDGIDGLMGSLSIAFFSVISALSLFIGEPGWLLISVPLMAGALGFLKFNWNPAKIFMGDSGSLMLGFSIAYLSLALSLIPLENSQFNFHPGISILFVAVWFTDTATTVGRRFAQKIPSVHVFFRRSKLTYAQLMRIAILHVFAADMNHLHHKFLRWGFSVPQTTLLLTIIAVSVMSLSIPTRLSYEPNVVVSNIEPLALMTWMLSLTLLAFTFFISASLKRSSKTKSESISRAA